MIKWEFIGRLHPLVLHVPIGLIFGLLLIEGLSWVVDSGTRAWRVCRKAYMTLLALSTVAAAVTGYILSLEGQTDGATLIRHKWLGITAAVVSLVLWILTIKSNTRVQAVFRVLVLWGLCALMVVTGHFGGQLTHGPHFLSTHAPPALQAFLGSAPLETRQPSADTSITLYGALIQPILDSHCVSCHGPDRQSGQFAVHTAEALMAGGRSGPAVLPGAPQDSELMKRLQLPPDEAGHMPPQGKAQLSPVQISALAWWIQAGASSDPGVNRDEIPQSLLSLLPQPDTTGQSSPEEISSHMDEALMRRLEDQQISIQRITQDDPRLWISFPAISDRVTDETVKQLMPLAPWIAWLDLSDTHVTSGALPWIAQMPALTELNLRHTGIDAEGLKSLVQNPNLERLNLSGISLDDTVVETLLNMPHLKRVYLWGSNVSQAGLQRLSAPRIEVITDATPSEVLSTDPNAVAE
ncbi:MAG: hypothetical protein K9N55_07985 [Phycisphaerae bacterium]|nr:hypothetical protein [Phycisphaerae bacterium]